jgi:GNAT superfamily N-acetyltransferase
MLLPALRRYGPSENPKVMHGTMSHAPEQTFHLEHVSWDDPRAVALRQAMDEEMTARYSVPGRAPLSPAAQKALSVDPSLVRATVLAIDEDGTAIGHAALRVLNGELEVKRVIVSGDQRGRGVGKAIMRGLEEVAREQQASRLILQTGDKQPEAVALYERLGWTAIPIYEPYAATMPFSLCYAKDIV